MSIDNTVIRDDDSWLKCNVYLLNIRNIMRHHTLIYNYNKLHVILPLKNMNKIKLI